MIDTHYYWELVKSILPKSRYDHTVRVVSLVETLGPIHHVSVSDSMISAICHDILKPLSPDLLEKEFLIKPSSYSLYIYKKFKPIWHSLCVFEFRPVLKTLTTSSLNAIKFHSTGSSSMSKIAQVLYVSDYCDPERDIPHQTYIISLAKRSLDEAVFAVSYLSLLYLIQQQLPIHPLSINCYNTFLTKLSLSKRKKILSQLT